jgi:hypothetical protein
MEKSSACGYESSLGGRSKRGNSLPVSRNDAPMACARPQGRSCIVQRLVARRPRSEADAIRGSRSLGPASSFVPYPALPATAHSAALKNSHPCATARPENRRRTARTPPRIRSAAFAEHRRDRRAHATQARRAPPGRVAKRCSRLRPKSRGSLPPPLMRIRVHRPAEPWRAALEPAFAKPQQTPVGCSASASRVRKDRRLRAAPAHRRSAHPVAT